MSQTNRYGQLFATLNETNQGAFVPFVTIGDPNKALSVEIIKSLIDGGADALELGIPFSDPIADGPVIQAANIRALDENINTQDCFDIIKQVREYNQDIPIGLLLYSNLVFARGIDAFYREAALHKLLKSKVSIPSVFYTNDTRDKVPHPFAIMEFIDGLLMRDVILQGSPEDIGNCAFSAGACLSGLRKITFNQPGFFDINLNVIPFSKQEDYLTFIQTCLESDKVKSAIGKELTNQLFSFTQEHACYFPEQNTANLTHADFDPSNMLVKKISNRYEVSAILDWEFAFAGTYFFDVGLFLRYSHRLPEAYERRFIEGVIGKNNPLPADWKKISKLLDILSNWFFSMRMAMTLPPFGFGFDCMFKFGKIA